MRCDGGIARSESDFPLLQKRKERRGGVVRRLTSTLNIIKSTGVKGGREDVPTLRMIAARRRTSMAEAALARARPPPPLPELAFRQREPMGELGHTGAAVMSDVVLGFVVCVSV